MSERAYTAEEMERDVQAITECIGRVAGELGDETRAREAAHGLGRILLAARRAREESGERIEGVAFRDGDCFARDDDGNCTEPSWIFVKTDELDGNDTDIPATLILHTGEPTDG